MLVRKFLQRLLIAHFQTGHRVRAKKVGTGRAEVALVLQQRLHVGERIVEPQHIAADACEDGPRLAIFGFGLADGFQRLFRQPGGSQRKVQPRQLQTGVVGGVRLQLHGLFVGGNGFVEFSGATQRIANGHFQYRLEFFVPRGLFVQLECSDVAPLNGTHATFQIQHMICVLRKGLQPLHCRRQLFHVQ